MAFIRLRLHAVNSRARERLLPDRAHRRQQRWQPGQYRAGPGHQCAPAAVHCLHREPPADGRSAAMYQVLQRRRPSRHVHAAGMTWVKKQVHYGLSDGKDLIEQAHAQGYKVLLGALGDKNQLANRLRWLCGEIRRICRLSGGTWALTPSKSGMSPISTANGPAASINGAQLCATMLEGRLQCHQSRQSRYSWSSAARPGADRLLRRRLRRSAAVMTMSTWQQMANAGAANYADCIGVHYNEGILPPARPRRRPARANTRRAISCPSCCGASPGPSATPASPCA